MTDALQAASECYGNPADCTGIAQASPPSQRKEYTAWNDMIRRCERPTNKRYPDYGGRGISVCERWRGSFAAFLEDMGRSPSPKHSIDRINVNGHYEPDNCRWATATEQVRNTRPRKDNASGVTGAHWSERHRKWRVRIAVNRVQISLGYAPTIEGARQLREAGEEKYWGKQIASRL
jgi:hypothetical protein